MVLCFKGFMVLWFLGSKGFMASRFQGYRVIGL